MYLILFILVAPLPRFPGILPAYLPEWTWFVPVLGINTWSAWAGIAGRKHYWTALVLLYIDMAAMLCGLGFVFYMITRFGSIEGSFFVVMTVVAVGGLLALYLARLGNIPRWLLPVGGSWGRRLFAGLAILLLAPLSPGVFLSATMWIPRPSGPLPKGPILGSIGLITALLYLAPLYRRIAEGTPPNLVLPKFATEVPELDDLLALHARRNRKLQHALARFVLLKERAVYNSFLDIWGDPAAAARRTRATIYSLVERPAPDTGGQTRHRRPRALPAPRRPAEPRTYGSHARHGAGETAP